MKKPRDYQIEGVVASEAALKRGVDRQLIVYATGLGKTFTAVTIAKKMKRMLWLTHREELIGQSALSFAYDIFEYEKANIISDEGIIPLLKRIKKQKLDQPSIFNPDANFYYEIKRNIGIIKEENFDIDAKYVFASVQTLYNRLELISPDHFDGIIIDEAHLSMAETWKACVEHFKFRILIGLTATPKRLDGLPLTHIFKEVVIEKDILFGIKNGWLVPIKAVRVKTKLNISKVSSTGGDFNTKDLEIINCRERNELIVESYIKEAKGLKAILFCSSVRHAIDLCEVFLEYGITASFVCADKNICPDRKQRLAKHKKGEIDVMLNVDILTAGYDDPTIKVIGHASPTQSLVAYLQRTGRGTRPLPGLVDGLDSAKDRIAAILNSEKPEMILLDFVDITTKHNLVNSFTLDEGKEIEDLVFVTNEERQKLEEERIRQLEAVTEETEYVDLLKLPKHNSLQFASDKMREPATPGQLDFLRKLGVYQDGVFYTKGQCTELISSAQASAAHKELLRKNGYDISMGCTIAQANAALLELRSKEMKMSTSFKGLM